MSLGSARGGGGHSNLSSPGRRYVGLLFISEDHKQVGSWRKRHGRHSSFFFVALKCLWRQSVRDVKDKHRKEALAAVFLRLSNIGFLAS